MKAATLYTLELKAMLDNIDLGASDTAQQLAAFRGLIHSSLKDDIITSAEYRILVDDSIRLQNEYTMRDLGL